MKFKILKGTPTFTKLVDLFELAKSYDNQAIEFATSLAARMELKSTGRIITPPDNLGGGCVGIEFERGQTKPADWRSVKGWDNVWYPSKRKTNGATLKAFTELPSVDKNELNKAVGYKSQFVGDRVYSYNPGFDLKKDCILMDVTNGAKFKPNADMVEILESEYVKLQGGK